VNGNGLHEAMTPAAPTNGVNTLSAEQRIERIADWLKSTSNRTFVAVPLALLAFELAQSSARRGGPTGRREASGRPQRRPALRLQPLAIPLMLWGYLQYRWVGSYRVERGGGGPGLSVPPERLCTEGPYARVRNPMYLGHLIYLAGTALTLRSRLGAVVLLAHLPWFQRRVRGDEERLQQLFGADYTAYKTRVGRWLPRLGRSPASAEQRQALTSAEAGP
jgi:hypothetical protein